MSTDGIVGNTECHPYHRLATRTAAHHLHNPRLVGVADGECLTLGVISVSLGKCSHHLDSLASRLRALQGEIDERTVVDYTCGIHHLLASAECCFTDGYLPLVDVADNIPCLSCLRYLTMIFICVPVEYLHHLALGMLSGRIMCKTLEHTIVVGTVAAHHGAIYTRLLAHDKVGASKASHVGAQAQQCHQ